MYFHIKYGRGYILENLTIWLNLVFVFIKDRNDQDSPIAALLQTMIVFDDKGIPHKVFL